MAHVKVAVIGAGSFVFGPSVLSEAILQHRLDGLELALMDVDGEVLERMAGVGRRMARDTGVGQEITTHTTRDSALAGADFVICCAAPQMQKRHAMDVAIIEDYLPGHQITEFGGIAGISYSLRQIKLITDLAGDIRRSCPDAWLLNVSNPLPRVCQAAHECGVKMVGFCSVSIAGLGSLSRLMNGVPSHYPFAEGRTQWSATMAGVNHLSWLIEFTDRSTGADLLPLLRQKLDEGVTGGNPRSEAIARETGYLLMPGDDHVKDFLKPEKQERPGLIYHGSGEERQQRLELMREIGAGTASWEPLLEHPSWEKPIDFVAAMAYDRPAEFHSLNLINKGQIPDLPSTAFVETPCLVSSAGVVPQTVGLPPSIRPYIDRTVRVTETIVRAAAERRLATVHEAVELDPTVLDKAAGIRAIDACLEAHSDILPQFEGLPTRR